MTRAALPAAIAATAGALWATRDYRAWLTLGKGGLPASPWGWLIATYFRLRSNDPLDASMVEHDGEEALLADIPERAGPRPRMAAWPIPNRQLDQAVDDGMRDRLLAAFDGEATARRNQLDYRLSYFEKRNQALTLHCPENGHADAAKSRGEIAHMHDDGSMHMIFSRADARIVIERGWGERHPSIGVLAALPSTYLYVYPPRDAPELAVVERLLDASITHMAATGNS